MDEWGNVQKKDLIFQNGDWMKRLLGGRQFWWQLDVVNGFRSTRWERFGHLENQTEKVHLPTYEDKQKLP